MESQFVEEEALWIHTGIKGEKGHIFWSYRLIALQVLQWFPEAVFLVVPMESQFVEEKALWIQTGITGEKGYNIWSNCSIALKVSH